MRDTDPQRSSLPTSARTSALNNLKAKENVIEPVRHSTRPTPHKNNSTDLEGARSNAVAYILDVGISHDT